MKDTALNWWIFTKFSIDVAQGQKFGAPSKNNSLKWFKKSNPFFNNLIHFFYSYKVDKL